MSSTGQGVGGVIGAVVGFYLGGYQGAIYGAQIGMTIGGLVDPPKGPTAKPKDTRVTTSTYGADIPRLYGAMVVSGNLIWLKGDRITPKKKKSGGKGGGTQTTTYQYFATCAFGLADTSKTGPVLGMRRLWLGGQLVYDGSATTTSGVIASGKKKGYWKLYLGTDTQGPDPLYQADKGSSNCSGWPGLCYIRFDNLPLDKYQDSLLGLNLKAELITAGEVTTTLLATQSLTGARSYFSAHGDEGSVSEYEYASLAYTPGAANTINYASCRSDLSNDIPMTFPNPGFDILGLNKQVEAISVFTYQRTTYSVGLESYYGTAVLLKNGVVSADLRPTKSTYYAWFAEVNTNYPHYGSHIWYADGAVFIGSSRLLGLGAVFVPDNIVGRWELSSSGPMPTDINDTSGVVAASAQIVVDDGYLMFVSQAGAVWILNPDKTIDEFTSRLEFVQTISVSFISGDFRAFAVDGDALYVVHGTGTNALKRYSIASGTSDRSYSVTPSTYGNRINIKGGVVYYQAQTTVYAIHFDFLSVGSIPLSDIVEAECLQSNLLSSSDIDVTDLATDMVRGYKVQGVGSIRSALEPLQSVFPFDIRPHGYEIQFVRRGNASSVAIDSVELDAREAGSKIGPLLTIPREMDTQLPVSVTLKHLDPTREYDTGAQTASRYNTDAVNSSELDLLISMTATEAAQAAEVLLYTWWRERDADIKFALPPSYYQIEPADVITVGDATGGSHVLRITNINYADSGVLDCTARREDYSAYTSIAVTDSGNSGPKVLGDVGGTAVYLMDLPALSASEDSPGFYVAACGVEENWAGAALLTSDDDWQSWSVLGGIPDPATMGFATTTLGAPVCFDAMDAYGRLTVRLYSGTLASVTHDELFAGANHFAYGVNGRWEIIAARSATLNGDGTYTLTEFLRGRLGTEQYSSSHSVNDQVVLLESTPIVFFARPLSSIGAAKKYRVVTEGGSVDDAQEFTLTYAGENIKPRSPVYLNGSRNAATNDWSLVWGRRARINAEWLDYVDVPLDEPSSEFEMEIYTTGYAALKRTLTGLISSATYTSAQQVSDFGSNQSTLYVKLYQISTRTGRGHPLTATLTR